MFIDRITLDCICGPDTRTEVVEEPSVEQVAEFVSRLDGRRHTMLSLEKNEGEHLIVGGGYDYQYVVFISYDGESFFDLTSPKAESGTVMLVCGDQLGDFKAHQVVGLDETLAAAQHFALHGEPLESLCWRKK